MAEEWVRNSRSETRVALDARDVAEAQLGVLKDKQAQMAEQVKDALRQKDSAEQVINHSTHTHLLNTIRFILTQTLEKLCKMRVHGMIDFDNLYF